MSAPALPLRRLPTKIVCVGKNYMAHAAELGSEVPEEPLIFLKPPSALLAPRQPIRMPAGAGRVDYEGEIALVVGEQACRVAEKEAWSYLETVFPLNDVTARDLQNKDDQWTRAKGFDTFCPVGSGQPAAGLDYEDLEVITRVNGEQRQHGRARDMAFSIPHLVAYISNIMTLEPGDLIATGTPDGIGPLAAGDIVRIEIPGVGAVENPVQAELEG